MTQLLIKSRDFLALAAAIALWELIAGHVYPRFNVNSQNIFPPPSAVAATAAELIASGELLRHIAASLRRVIAGFVIAAAVAIPLGLSMGAWPGWRRQMTTVIEVLRPIPPFAWIPIGLLWFGVGDEQSIFVIFIAAFFPMLLNTVAGVDAVDSVHRRSALCLGASRLQLFLQVVLRGALPQIFVGLRISLGFAWMVVVASELIGSVSGLGHLILDSRNLGLPSLAFMGMIVIGIVGYAIDVAVRRLERALLPWRS